MMLKNEIALTYLRARYGEEDIITSDATAETPKRPEEQLYRLSTMQDERSASDSMELKNRHGRVAFSTR
jgi:hypothetical protein